MGWKKTFANTDLVGRINIKVFGFANRGKPIDAEVQVGQLGFSTYLLSYHGASVAFNEFLAGENSNECRNKIRLTH